MVLPVQRRRPALVAAATAAVALLLAGCAGEPSGSGSGGADASPTPSWSISRSTASPAPTPTQTATAAEIPTDCRAILTEAVLSEIGGTPLNDPAFAPTGVQSDGSLVCVWRDPGADTTGIRTKISRMNRGPALDLLNQLADAEGFTCYTPDGGTRCEKTWQNEQYPVEDGRTLFWRDDVLIDTSFSNMFPSGYTSAIVQSVFE